MRQSDIDILIYNILNDSATEEDIVTFSEWIQDKENADYFENAKQYWHISEIKDINIPVSQSGKTQLLSRIKREKKHILRRRVISWSAVSAATVAALIISIQSINRVDVTDKPQEKISTVIPVESKKIDIDDEISVVSTSKGNIIRVVKLNPSDNIAYQDFKEDSITSEEPIVNTLIVPKGKRVKIMLSDSTQVWVNSDSKIIYPATFGDKNRSVIVHGNAFFDVAKDKSRPFIVITNNLKTTALGTSFEVNNYDKSKCSVSLVEGLVSIEGKNTKLIIKPNRQVISDGLSLKEESFNPNNCGLWRNNILSFNNETLSSVIEKLCRWHNVQIINQTKDMEHILFTGKMDDDSIDAHLKVISKNIKIVFTREGDNIIIKN